jgi:hypothetical protein
MSQFLIEESINLQHIKKLKKFIKKSFYKDNEINIKLKSTRGLKSKQYKLLQTEDNKEVFDIVKKETVRCLKKHRSKNLDIKPVSSWIVCGQEHGYHELHRHNNNPLSDSIATVTYLDVPKSKDKGTFYCIVEGNAYGITPKVGKLLILPVNVFHGTYPQGKGLRTTLNIDFEIIHEL